MEGLEHGGAGRGQGQPMVDTQLTVTSQALHSPTLQVHRTWEGVANVRKGYLTEAVGNLHLEAGEDSTRWGKKSVPTPLLPWSRPPSAIARVSSRFPHLCPHPPFHSL